MDILELPLGLTETLSLYVHLLLGNLSKSGFKTIYNYHNVNVKPISANLFQPHFHFETC